MSRNEADSLNADSGIPKEEVKGLFQAFKNRKVPWSRAEIVSDEKRRMEALEYIIECRAKAGIPVEDKAAYDGSRVKTAGELSIMPDIMGGKFSNEKAVMEAEEAASETPKRVTGDGVGEDVWEGIGDGKTTALLTEHMR